MVSNACLSKLEKKSLPNCLFLVPFSALSFGFGGVLRKIEIRHLDNSMILSETSGTNSLVAYRPPLFMTHAEHPAPFK